MTTTDNPGEKGGPNKADDAQAGGTPGADRDQVYRPPPVGSVTMGEVESKVEVDPSLEMESERDAEANGDQSAKVPSRSGAGARRPSRDEPTRRLRTSRESGRSDAPTEPPSRRSRRRVLGIPRAGWLLVAVVLVGLLFLYQDIHNRGRYMMRCSSNKVDLHAGRTFPWPYGFEPIGGSQFTLSIPAEADCRQRIFLSLEEAERAFLDFILDQVKRTMAGSDALNHGEIRQQLSQALLLTRTQRTRRKETQKLLAELAYREGRTVLSRVENELRTALTRFQDAQKLDGERFEDLEDWIDFLENLLKSVAPSPAITPTLPLPSRPIPGKPPLPAGSSPARGKDLGSGSNDAGSPGGGQDAGASPPASGGILM